MLADEPKQPGGGGLYVEEAPLYADAVVILNVIAPIILFGLSKVRGEGIL